MNIRTGIRNALLANAALVALVGQRITSSYAPNTTPVESTWIVMTLINGAEEGSFDGNSQLTHPTFQFTIGGADKEKVDEVQRLLVQMHCTEYDYTEGENTFRLTFFHSDARDAMWEGGTRVSEASVDLQVWTNT